MLATSCFLALFAASATGLKSAPRRPNILWIVADDYGHANLGHNNPNKAEAYTPNLDALIEEGIYLDRHYAYKICGPSRSSMQSGRLAVHVNAFNTAPTVHNVSDPISGYAGIPRNMTGIAQKMKAAGYSTAMTGKWDAGMATPDHTPYGRGYEEFYGYYMHANNYWTKGIDLESTGEIDTCLNKFTDLSHLNDTYRGGVRNSAELDSSCHLSDESDPECYEERIFKEKTLGILGMHDFTTKPLFMYHAFHLVHTPLLIPKSYIKRAEARADFDNEHRKKYSAMTEYMDEAVGEFVAALKARGEWENTLLVFLADNGGPTYAPGSGNNHPLKGGKYSDWEGGVRVNAFVSGGYLPKRRRGTTFAGVMSGADWYGIFCDIAGVSPEDERAAKANKWLEERDLPLLPPVDAYPGIWDAILTGDESRARGSSPLHLSDHTVLAYPFKLVTGRQAFSSWTGPSYPNCSSGATQPTFEDFVLMGHHARFVKDDEATAESIWAEDCGDRGCLFNVEADPNEHVDLSEDPEHQETLEKLQTTLAELNKGLFLPFRGGMVVEACHAALDNGGFYGPFVDTEGFYTHPPTEEDEEKLLARQELNFMNQPAVSSWAHEAGEAALQAAFPFLTAAFEGCEKPADATNSQPSPPSPIIPPEVHLGPVSMEMARAGTLAEEFTNVETIRAEIAQSVKVFASRKGRGCSKLDSYRESAKSRESR